MNEWPQYSRKEIALVSNLLKSGKINIWQNNDNKNFENNFSKYVGTKYALSVSNGSAALDIALKAIEIKKGDEVIVTPKSYFISAACVINLKAIPIFADVDYDSQNLNLENIQKKITARTKAIICVHLGGLPCEIYEISKFAKKNNIKLIEDCAQAHGAKINNKVVGSFGDIACWSFCKDKIISSGEGGMIATNNKKIFEKSWSLREGGRNIKFIKKKAKNIGFKYIHDFFGMNSRMTNLQVSLCNYQLKNLDKNIIKRNIIAKKYIKIIKKYKFLETFTSDKNTLNAYYRVYFKIKNNYIKNGNRDKILKNLISNNLPFEEGSCSEIYKEKSFKKIAKYQNLPNAHKLSKSSMAIRLNHHIKSKELNKTLIKFEKILNNISISIFKNEK